MAARCRVLNDPFAALAGTGGAGLGLLLAVALAAAAALTLIVEARARISRAATPVPPSAPPAATPGPS